MYGATVKIKFTHFTFHSCTTGSVSRYSKDMDGTCNSRKLFVGRREKALEMRMPMVVIRTGYLVLCTVHKRRAAKAVIELDAFPISVQDRSKVISCGLRLLSC